MGMPGDTGLSGCHTCAIWGWRGGDAEGCAGCWRHCTALCPRLLLEVLGWKGTWEGRGEPWPWVCSVPGRVCVVSTAQTQPDRACGRAAASPRPPSTAGQIHLFIAITPGLCDPAALGLCLGKRLCWEGAKRVLCGFPWKPEHEDGSSSQALLRDVPI